MKNEDIEAVVSLAEAISQFDLPVDDFYPHQFPPDERWKIEIGFPDKFCALANDYADGIAEDLIFEALRLGTFIIAERVLTRHAGIDPATLRGLAVLIEDQKLAPISEEFRHYLWMSGTVPLPRQEDD